MRAEGAPEARYPQISKIWDLTKIWDFLTRGGFGSKYPWYRNKIRAISTSEVRDQALGSWRPRDFPRFPIVIYIRNFGEIKQKSHGRQLPRARSRASDVGIALDFFPDPVYTSSCRKTRPEVPRTSQQNSAPGNVLDSPPPQDWYQITAFIHKKLKNMWKSKNV